MPNRRYARSQAQQVAHANRGRLLVWAILLLIMIASTACRTAGDPSTTPAESAVHAAPVLQSAPQPIPFPQIDPDSVVAAQTSTDTPYLEAVDIVLDEVKYLSLVESALPLSSDERDRLTQNGFVVSDRYNWERFLTAYAWIYWKDLPVLVTTDALLHAFHQSYVDILTDLELSTLKPQLAELLETTAPP